MHRPDHALQTYEVAPVTAERNRHAPSAEPHPAPVPPPQTPRAGPLNASTVDARVEAADTVPGPPLRLQWPSDIKARPQFAPNDDILPILKHVARAETVSTAPGQVEPGGRSAAGNAASVADAARGDDKSDALAVTGSAVAAEPGGGRLRRCGVTKKASIGTKVLRAHPSSSYAPTLHHRASLPFLGKASVTAKVVSPAVSVPFGLQKPTPGTC